MNPTVRATIMFVVIVSITAGGYHLMHYLMGTKPVDAYACGIGSLVLFLLIKHYEREDKC